MARIAKDHIATAIAFDVVIAIGGEFKGWGLYQVRRQFGESRSRFNLA